MNPKGYADKIPVFCEHTKIVPTEDLLPNPKNDNVHPETQIRLLANIIERLGWRRPITISTRSGLISRGEGRYLSARFKGWREVPIDYQDYATEADELTDLKADNRIGDLSHFDPGREIDLLRELREAKIDLAEIGFTEDDLGGLLDPIDVDQFFEPIDAEAVGPADDKTDTCPLCGATFLLSQAKKLRKPKASVPVEVEDPDLGEGAPDQGTEEEVSDGSA